MDFRNKDLGTAMITGIAAAATLAACTSTPPAGRPADAPKYSDGEYSADGEYVDRLAGSSRTPDGFNAALEQIKAEASK